MHEEFTSDKGFGKSKLKYFLTIQYSPMIITAQWKHETNSQKAYVLHHSSFAM